MYRRGAGVGRFAVVFAPISLAWNQWSRPPRSARPGRGADPVLRLLQMGVLSQLAVFTGEATAGDGLPSPSSTARTSSCSAGPGTRCAVRTTQPPVPRRRRTSPGRSSSSASRSWTGWAEPPRTPAPTRASR